MRREESRNGLEAELNLHIASEQSHELLERQLHAGEHVLWWQEGGRIPVTAKLGYIAALVLIPVWMTLAARDTLSAWQPDVPLIVKLILALLFTGWACLMGWAVWLNLRSRNSFLFAVSDHRLLVSNMRWPTLCHSVWYDEVSSVDAISSNAVRIRRRRQMTLNGFWTYADWHGVRSPDKVKALIDQRLVPLAQEIPS